MSSPQSFAQFNLPEPITQALSELGYETPTPIQISSIPVLLAGRDILAQAQTGSGKTAAFALPVLADIDLSVKRPQALVIAPTRELAIQVAEAFQSYAKYTNGFNVCSIYGGQDYQVQLRALKRGPQVIVGTPGRLMDHLRRGSLNVESINTVVLDEADEMLNMGFIEDIEWILAQCPTERRTALFSATMPKKIQNISNKYLKKPEHIHIQPPKNTLDQIQQSYIISHKEQKLEVLTRYLEMEELDAVIIFARTKTYSAELAEKLQARGYAAAALHGDMEQNMRKKVMDRMKQGGLDILVATDVAARGIDIDRITHVINYDIPYDTESYIHRIGRTGRAGRTGKALLLVTPREKRLLGDIKHAVKAPLRQIEPPSVQELNIRRSEQLTAKVSKLMGKSKKMVRQQKMLESMLATTDYSAEEIATALLYMIDQANPLPTNDIEFIEDKPSTKRKRPANKKPAPRKDKPKENRRKRAKCRF